MDSQISIRWVDSADAIDSNVWDECFPPPLEGRWWYQALERSGLEDQFKFSYALIEDAGKPVGIAPCFLMDVPMDIVAPPAIAWLLRQAGRIIPRANYQRTFFIGSPCADEGTVGLCPDTSLKSVALSLQHAAVEQARLAKAVMVVWKDFPAEIETSLKILIGQAGMFRATSYPGTRAAIGPGGFARYLESMRSSHRHNLKKKLRRGEATGPLECSVIQHPDAQTLDQIFALFWQTYEKGKTKFEKLNRDFFQQIAGCEVSRWIILRHPKDGKSAAFMLCFLLGQRVINKFVGLDYTLQGDWYLYFRLWREAVEWASTIGATEIQSGQTGYRAKLDVDHALTPLTNYCRNLNPLMNWVYAKIARRITWETLDEDLNAFAHSRRQQSH